MVLAKQLLLPIRGHMVQKTLKLRIDARVMYAFMKVALMLLNVYLVFVHLKTKLQIQRVMFRLTTIQMVFVDTMPKLI